MKSKNTMNTQLAKLLALNTAAALATATTSQAASILWGAPANISADTDVSTTGTPVGAVNAGFTNLSGTTFNPATTVNGVTFAPLNSASSSGLFSVPLVGPGVTLGAGAPFSNLSTAYQNLLQAGFFGLGAGGVGFTLTLSGLTVGNTYELQIWSENPGFSPGIPDTLTVATGVSTVTLRSNVTNTAGGLGQFVRGSFVADGATQAVSITSPNNGIFNGAQLRQTAAPVVPEPSSVLFGLGLLGMAAFRRVRPMRRTQQTAQ